MIICGIISASHVLDGAVLSIVDGTGQLSTDKRVKVGFLRGKQ